MTALTRAYVRTYMYAHSAYMPYISVQEGATKKVHSLSRHASCNMRRVITVLLLLFFAFLAMVYAGPEVIDMKSVNGRDIQCWVDVQNPWRDIFVSNNPWPEEEHVQLGSLFILQDSACHPFTQFGSHVDLMYFTKDEYVTYGQLYWTTEQWNVYLSYPHPFEYAVVKTDDDNNQVVRFLNYSKATFYMKQDISHRFQRIGEADQNYILTLTSQRLYGLYKEHGCSLPYVMPKFLHPLVMQVFHHTVLGYDHHYRSRPNIDFFLMTNYTDEMLLDEIQGHSDRNIQRVRKREQIRRNIMAFPVV